MSQPDATVKIVIPKGLVHFLSAIQPEATLPIVFEMPTTDIKKWASEFKRPDWWAIWKMSAYIFDIIDELTAGRYV